MPRALAIETSGRVGSIALVDDQTIGDEQTFEHGLQNAARILPSIDAMVRAKNWSPGDIEQVYVSVGPGSFTGLRIGVTIAKTMALASGATIVAVPTVKVLAENAPADAKHLIIVLDAKREQIFTARFTRTDGWIEAEPAHVDSLSEMLARSPRPVHLLGEGIPFHRKYISDDPQVIVTADSTWRAASIDRGKAGAGNVPRAGEFADPFKLTPIYIRRPEAEEKMTR